MIRSIIIDDEQHCVQSLKTDLEKYCPAVEVVAECLSAKEGIFAIKKLKPELVFLDVQMPLMNGFELLEIIDTIDFAIIFTTAYDKFAARAFRISAVDYLLKPIDAAELQDAIKKAEQKIHTPDGTTNIENLLKNIRQPVADQKIALPFKDGFEFIEARHIMYCEAEGAYTRFYLDNKKQILVCRTLGDVEELVPREIFQRIHHSTIVNVLFVSHFFRSDGGYVIMSSGQQLHVSKSRKDAVMQKFGLK